MSKKIIIDGRGLRFGTGRYVRKLLEYLQKIDQENSYVVLVNEEDEAAWSPLKKSKNFARETVPFKHYSIGEQISFALFLRKKKADLVWFTMPQQPLFYFGKKITTIHDLILLRFKNVKRSKIDFFIKQTIFRVFVKWVARQSVAILTLTKHSRQDIVNYTKVDPDKVAQIYLSADKITASPKSIPELSGKKFLLYVGNAHVHKNLPQALYAFKELKVDHPDLHFAFAGNETPHYERLGLLADTLGLGKYVHLLGFVTDSELRWAYENATVYVFPTLDEGFGLPGLEAMQYDVPVAASNASCLPEVYEDAVQYFDPSDAASMAAAIDGILKDTKLAKSLTAKGRKLLKKYSWEKAAEETFMVIEHALNG